MKTRIVTVTQNGHADFVTGDRLEVTVFTRLFGAGEPVYQTHRVQRLGQSWEPIKALIPQSFTK